MIKNEIFSVAFRLFVITAVSALCLAFVNKTTAPVIEKNRISAAEEGRREVLETAESFESVNDISSVDLSQEEENGTYIEELYRGIDADGRIAGYVVSAVSTQGYGGDIKVMVGIGSDLKISRVKITESSETAGLGLKASEPEFINQFNLRNTRLRVVKNISPTKEGEEIAAVSSATVTSKAVTNAVNISLRLAEEIDKAEKTDKNEASNEKNSVEAVNDKTDSENKEQMTEEE